MRRVRLECLENFASLEATILKIEATTAIYCSTLARSKNKQKYVETGKKASLRIRFSLISESKKGTLC